MSDVLRSQPEFSLIVPTLGRNHEIGRLLDSLSVPQGATFELILVDQNPEDTLSPILEPYLGRMDIMHIRSGLKGLSLNRNIGLEKAKGRWAAFPDDDCWYSAGLLGRVKDIFLSRPELTGIVGQWLDGKEASPVRLCELLNTKRVFAGCSSITLFFRTFAVRRAGGFDESLGVGAGTPWMSGEETDLLLKILEGGGTVYRDSALEVYHKKENPTEIDEAMIRKAEAYQTGKGRILRLHHAGLFKVSALILKQTASGVLKGLLWGNRNKWSYQRGLSRGILRGYFAPKGEPRKSQAKALKIAVDARPLTNPLAGIGSYLIEALSAMAKENPDHEWVLLSNRPLVPEAEAAIAPLFNARVKLCPLPFLKNVGLLWYLFGASKAAKAEKVDVFWAPGHVLPPSLPKRIKTLVTVHDFVFYRFPETMHRPERLYFKFFFKPSIARADLLWAVSESTQSELEGYFPKRRAKEILTGQSVNDALSGAEAVPGLPEAPFALFVGSLEPRKNLRFLLKLAPGLHERGMKLFVVGGSGWGKTDIAGVMETPGFPKEAVVFSGYLSKGQLRTCYERAALYLSASLYEGFGRPQLEAMRQGCPVVCADNSAMPEVMGDGGIAVPGWAENDWLAAIDRVMEDRAAYSQKALARAAKFDWKKIARTILKAMETEVKR